MLLAGELPLRYYSGNFPFRKPSWSLPDYGGVQVLLSAEGSGLGLVEFPAARGRESSGGLLGSSSWRDLEENATYQENGQFVGLQAWCSPCPSWC